IGIEIPVFPSGRRGSPSDSDRLTRLWACVATFDPAKSPATINADPSIPIRRHASRRPIGNLTGSPRSSCDGIVSIHHNRIRGLYIFMYDWGMGPSGRCIVGGVIKAAQGLR